MSQDLKGAAQYTTVLHDGAKVAVITLDQAPVNALSAGTRTDLERHFRAASADSSITALVVTGAHNQFCAGADISEFGSGDFAAAGPNLVELVAEIEQCNKPVVAAINGVALGGGLEVALGCHYRLGTPRSRAALPEVNIGLLPGAGGTQRLPLLVGPENAVNVMTTGSMLPADAAKQLGIFDDVVTGDVVAAAVAFAVGKARAGGTPRRICDIRPTAPPPGQLAALGAKVAAKRAGEFAPGAIIKCITAACDPTTDFAAGIAVEAKLFGQCMLNPQSAALQHFFFAERLGSKVAGVTARPIKIKSIGIIGAGLMGGGIAMCCANVGIKTVLVDVDQASLDKGIQHVRNTYGMSVARKSRTQPTVDRALALITPTLAYADLASVDMVIEAVYENLAVKQNIFTQLDAVCKPGCVLATNTSGLDVDKIAAATARPDQVIGCHFFSPANVMTLLENVRGARSSDVVIATAMAFGKQIGKTPVLVGNCAGFVGNRMIGHYSRAALATLTAGAKPFEVDGALRNFGMKMGPLNMADLTGLDLFGRERERRGQLEPDRSLPDWLYSVGRYGIKTGGGYFDYDAKRRPSRNAQVEARVAEIAATAGVPQRRVSEAEIVNTVLMPLVNEGFNILDEGIAQRPSDIDVVYVYGYGFPKHKGGPMYFADTIGLDTVLAEVKAAGIRPAPLLEYCVAHGLTLAQWSQNPVKTGRTATAVAKL